MAKVEWSTGIDSVSGALSKPSKSGQHSCTKMLLGTHRVAATTSDACNRVYLRKKIKRSTPVSSDERAQRTRFGAICKAVALRRKDLAHVAEDLAAFKVPVACVCGRVQRLNGGYDGSVRITRITRMQMDKISVVSVRSVQNK